MYRLDTYFEANLLFKFTWQQLGSAVASDAFTIFFQRTKFLSAASFLPFRTISSEILNLFLSIVFWKKIKWLLGFVLFGRE